MPGKRQTLSPDPHIQEYAMTTTDLPSRFPVGTRYVVEGRPGRKGEMHIVSRQVIMPNGEAIELKAGTVSFARQPVAVRRLNAATRARSAKRQ